MSFNANRSKKQIIEYKANDTYNALIRALEKGSPFFIKALDPTSRTIALETGISWRSWGENLLITVRPIADNKSELFISSTSKLGLIDWGKNQDNLNNVLKILFEELKNYDNAVLNNTDTAENIFAQISKLFELKEAGILTNEEFQQKKEELLARL